MINDEFFMKQALQQAEKALSVGEFPVGCVIADKEKIVSVGSRKGTAGNPNQNPANTSNKLLVNETDHAEIMALRSLNENSAIGTADDLTIFSTMEPCLMCFGAILISGIKRIVYAYEDAMGGGTGCDLSKLPSLYDSEKIIVIPHVLREESLTLFKSFFSNPDNDYWKNSLLAKYTLAQK